MPETRFTHRLTGCAPIPLAHFLKALGILRLVAEQADPAAQGWWSGDVFHLRTTLDEAALQRFFLEQYEPTPLVGPWGARSGFFASSSEKSARESLAIIEGSDAGRLRPFREAICSVRQVLASLGLTEKADSIEDKRRLMMQCRAQFPDQLLAWLDTTYMLLGDETKFPPLLGTGGNEGSGSYMSGFSQQVASVIANRKWDHALQAAIYGEPQDRLTSSQTPGHFAPDAAGGPNASSTSEGNVVTNPWDYLLNLEGTLVFAAAAVRRMEDRDGGELGFPFCVRQSGVGYASSASSDEPDSRAEMWLPLWPSPSTFPELRSIFSEGRSQVGGRASRSGVDFARAIAGLGIDRGIGEFQRFAFQMRNGLSYFAIPLGRYSVHANSDVNLLSELRLDAWLESFRSAASGNNAPSRANRSLRRLETAILELCREKSPVNLQEVLIALGEAESVLSLSPKWRAEAFQHPVPLLSPQWVQECDDHQSTEFRLAASLAAMYSDNVGSLRPYCEPVVVNGSQREGGMRWVEWAENSQALCRVVWNKGRLIDNLMSIVKRRVQEAIQAGFEAPDGATVVFPAESPIPSVLPDINQFLAGETDDERLSALFRGLLLIDWAAFDKKGYSATSKPEIASSSAAYSLLKLCHNPFPVRETYVRLDSAISRLACGGRLDDATRLASRRLLGSGLPPAAKVVAGGSRMAQRIAAAILFPVQFSDINSLGGSILKPQAVSR